MLNIPDNYYDAEIRNGFYIESKMKRAWAAQIEVLEEIRRICQNHNIPFFADWEHFLVQYATMDLFHGTMIWI